MDKKQFYEIFTDVFSKNNLDIYLKDDIIKKFAALTDIMLETNAVMNITALTTLEKIIPLHYADCVMVAPYIQEGSTVLDVGCGGGFPILPLAIVRPDLKLTGLDSTEKKVNYVQKAADSLNLSIQTVSGRAEELAHNPNYREKYDVVISRAVARLNILNELCLPLVKPGGAFLAMKGAAGQVELAESISGSQKLGGKIGWHTEYLLRLPDTTEKRMIIRMDKTASTPSAYPRAFGALKKKPL